MNTENIEMQFQKGDVVEVIYPSGDTTLIEVKGYSGFGDLYDGKTYCANDMVVFKASDAILVEDTKNYWPGKLWMERIKRNAALMDKHKAYHEAKEVFREQVQEAKFKINDKVRVFGKAEIGVVDKIRPVDKHGIWYNVTYPSGISEWEAEKRLSLCEAAETEPKPELINHPDYYNRYSVEVVEMARRIWGDEAMKAACEITAFIYRMRAGIKPDNPIEQDIRKETWWLEKYKEIQNGR